MHSSKLRPPVITMKQQDEGSSRTIRWCLLVWAILRLLVSVLWTGTVITGSVVYFRHITHENKINNNYAISRLWTSIYCILVQLVEFGMLVTFITAGIKKSVKLYRAYYRYCILTVITYAIAVILCFTAEYFGFRNDFIEPYLTYHFDNLPIVDDSLHFYIVFVFLAICDIGLEIFLIFSIRKLINIYSTSTSVETV